MKHIWTIFLLASAVRGADVTLSMTPETWIDNFVRTAAAGQTVRMFAAIGVRLDWNPRKPETPDNTIRIQVRFIGDIAGHPGAMAFSNPFDPAPVVTVMYDRIVAVTKNNSSWRVPLLAHALSHEIGHLLMRTDAHSPDGVMKSHWEREDYGRMAYRPLPFLPGDIEMIHRGVIAMARADARVHPAAP